MVPAEAVVGVEVAAVAGAAEDSEIEREKREKNYKEKNYEWSIRTLDTLAGGVAAAAAAVAVGPAEKRAPKRSTKS